MNISVKLEKKKDWHNVEIITREAFWNSESNKKNGIGCDEHYLVHTLRTAPEFIPELDFIAEVKGNLVGNIMYSKAYILLPNGEKHNVIIFGPLSVLPEYQKQGVGSILMHHSLKVATKLGYGSVLFYGHPSYYTRFGFKEAKAFGITTHNGENFPAFMAMELIKGDLNGENGKFIIPSIFDVDPIKAKEYDLLFPMKK